MDSKCRAGGRRGFSSPESKRETTTASSPEPSSPPKIAPFKPISPFQLPVLDTFGIRKHLEDKTKLNNMGQVEQQSERKRVDSRVKRQALGWGRKRDSDRPEMIVNVDKPAKSESGPKISAPKPPQLKRLILPAKASARLKNKENVYMDETSSSFISGPERAINKPCAFTPIKFWVIIADFACRRPLKERGTRSPAKRKPVPRYVASQPSGLRV